MTDPKAPTESSQQRGQALTRRDVVKGLGVVATLPLVGMACVDGSTEPPVDGGPALTDAGTVAPDSGVDANDGGRDDAGPTDAGANVDDAGANDDDAGQGGIPWATGGTAAMTAAASYPNPFTSGLADPACTLLCRLTLGPCYGPAAPVRQDISDGEDGIPMRLMLRIVEADGCTPVANAEAEVWYCNTAGRYSGDDVAAVTFCTGGDAFAEAANFARGRAISDADGVLTFDGTYPGWYPGRAIHIHVLVRREEFVGGVSGSDTAIVSQLLFPEALTAEIFNDVAGYRDRGAPDTTNSTDGVLRNADDVETFVAGYEKMSDGAMLAWKTVAISDAESC